MGMIAIWDGEDLPPAGCEVLIEHGRDDDLHPCIVTSYEIKGTDNKFHHRVFINVVYKGQTTGNQRLLYEVHPITYRKPQP